MPQKDETEPEQIILMKRMVDQNIQQNQMSAERNYLNTERTLSLWLRSALVLMLMGLALDRFGLTQILHHMPGVIRRHTPDMLSMWGGMAFVSLGTFTALIIGSRFLAYVVAYSRNHDVAMRHGLFLAPFFAFCVALFGAALLVLFIGFVKGLA